MKQNLLKSKYGLLWLVFCVFVVVVLQNFQFQTPLSNYNNGFLERLGGGGHTFEKHVGKSDGYLFDRLRTEDISAASTFNTVAEAEVAIRNTLIKRGDLIHAWLKTERSNKKAFYHKMQNPVGRVLKRGWNEPREGNQTRVILIRDENYDTGFFILTAYPELK